jgi:hypothetical protein
VIKRTFRILVYLLAGLTAVLAVCLALAAWRLSQGPVSLALLTPMVERILSDPSQPFTIRLGDSVLTWAGWERALDIRFVDVRVIGSEGAVIARVPEISVGLNVAALVRGVVAPMEIELFRPSVRLRRQPDGTLDVDFAEESPGSEAFFDRVLADLLAPPNPDNAMSYLEGVRINDARVIFEDRSLGISWKGTSSVARLWREGDSLKTEAFLTIALGAERADLAMIGEYNAPQDRLDLGVSFDDVRPASFARVAPALKMLEAFDLPLRGTVTLETDGAGVVEGIGFDIIGGVGDLALPVPIAHDVGVPALALGLAVRGGQLHGRYESAAGKIEIDHVNITLEEGGTVFVPAPIDHEFPLASINGKGRYFGDDERIEVDSLEVDLAGPQVTVSGTLDGVGDAMTGNVSVTVNDLKADDLPLYWPRSVKSDAQEWSVASLSAGVVPEARFDLTLRPGADGVEVTKLAGTIDFVDLTVDYLPPMPKARKVSGTASLDLEKLAVSSTGGEVLGVTLRKGNVVLSQLDQPVERADIELDLAGSVGNVLELIDHQPLGYAKAMEIDPANTDGVAVGHVKFGFPLLKTLGLDELEIVANAQISDLAIKDAVFGKDITDGKLDLKVDKKGMDAKGRITLGSVESDLVWRENFTDGAPFNSRFNLDIANADVSFLKDLGLEMAPIIATDLAGRVGANVQLTLLQGDVGRIEARIDTTEASLNFPLLGWKKPIGEAGKGELAANMTGGRLTDIPRFALSGNDLNIAGAARFGAEGEAEQIDLETVTHGRTDLSGQIALHGDGGSDIFISGRSLDLEPIWTVARSGAIDVDASGEQDPKFTLTADIGEAWLGEDRRIEALLGTFVSDLGTWTLVQGSGLVGGGDPIEFSITPGDGAERILNIEAGDAGSTLRTLGIYPNMVGGVLKIEGTFDDSEPDQPLKGRLKVKDYRLINAPGLAQVLSVMALSGILDALRGDGIAFSKLDVPFKWKNNILDIEDAQASGSSLGVTASGKVQGDSETVDIKGTVVPFYAVNSVLGKIPVLGDLLTGGEKGGGVFAARYTMTGPLANPEVSVNPVSALAPGFLRNLFAIFESGNNGEGWAVEPQGDEHP